MSFGSVLTALSFEFRKICWFQGLSFQGLGPFVDPCRCFAKPPTYHSRAGSSTSPRIVLSKIPRKGTLPQNMHRSQPSHSSPRYHLSSPLCKINTVLSTYIRSGLQGHQAPRYGHKARKKFKNVFETYFENLSTLRFFKLGLMSQALFFSLIKRVLGCEMRF